ncbi:MAG: tetratricopeptide repeat-containing sensor histidine kinase [Cytophagaceae bacterium]|jgi:signal transduction histidine kinase|nr:tetratricopeptide repeat-containing sensor histidine kinase [Cytophagaceae bacterium]
MYNYCRYIVIVIFLSLTGVGMQGQNGEETPDTTSGMGLVKEASRFFDINSRKTEEYALRALEIGKQEDDHLLINKAYYQLARVNFRHSRNEKALEYVQMAETGFTKLNSLHDLADLYSTWANGLFNMGDNVQSDYYSDKSITLAKQSNNYQALSTQLYTRGMKAYRNNDIYLALDYLNETLAITEKHPELERTRGYCCSLISSIYIELGEKKLGLEYRKLAVSSFEKLQMAEILIVNYSNLAFDYLPNMPDSAFYYANKALQAQRDSKVEHSLSTVYHVFHQYYAALNNYDSASYYIDKSIEIAEKYNRMSSAVIYYSNAGNYYLNTGDFDKALFYAKKVEQFSVQTEVPALRQNALQNIAKIYYSKEQFDSAAYYFNEHSKSDTLQTIKKIKQNVVKLSEVRAREQSEFKLREEQNKRNILFYFIAGCVVLIALLTVFLQKISKQRNTINLINEDLREHQDELKLLVEYKSRQLDDKEKQYANLCDNMFNGAVFRIEAVSIEPLELTFSFVSNGWVKITGLPIDNLAEMMFGFKQNIPADERKQLFDAIENAFKTGSVVDETFSFNKENKKTWFHIRAVSASVQEQVFSLDGYMVDETEQKIFEKKLVAAKERAEEADRLKTAFLNNVSHEIRTPMNAIIGFSSLIIDDLIPEEEKEIFLKTINDNCFQLLQIVNDIVEISQIEAEQTVFYIHDITVGDILDDVNASVIPQYREKYPNLEIRLDENIEKMTSAPLRTDRARLVQVIDYLINNATKFTPKGYVELGIIPKAGNIHFYVKDSGVGIAPNDIERIFHRFTKINPAAQSGTGLGLPIVHKILDKLGGKIYAESIVNIGSIFHVTIPEK